MVEPTPEQEAQAALVAHDLIETINRLGREGFPPQIVLLGLGAAACDAVTSIRGSTAVVPWFVEQAAIAQSMIDEN